MSTNARIRVAICGGGITGLCLAVALSKHDHLEIAVYEAASRFKEIGAGVMLWSRTWKILDHMGLAPQLSAIASARPEGKLDTAFDFRRADLAEGGHRYFLFERPDGCIRFHRAQFLDVLIDNLPPGIANFGKRLTHYVRETTGLYTMWFADGSSASCDLLVGCDGIKSAIRRQFFTQAAERLNRPELLKFIEPVWTGALVYRGLIPLDQVPKAPDGTPHRAVKAPTMYCGKGAHIVCYMISRGSTLNVVACRTELEKHGEHYPEPWVTDCSPEEVLSTFDGWEPEILDTLKVIKNPTRWAIHHLAPLPFFYSGRVVLIGDAAHASTPHQGAGAGQGIEDAFVLAHLLGAITSTEQLEPALEAFEHVRLPLANHVLTGSFESSKIYQFNSKYGSDYGQMRSAIANQWSWIDETEPMEEAERALQYMQSESNM